MSLSEKVQIAEERLLVKLGLQITVFLIVLFCIFALHSQITKLVEIAKNPKPSAAVTIKTQ